MNRFSHPFHPPMGLLLAGALLLFVTACDKKPSSSAQSPESTHDHASMQKGEGGEQLYQCSMHPNVISDKPGQCPICAMDLQPVKKIDAEGIPGRAPVQLTAQQEQLINIRIVPVKDEQMNQTIRARGIIRHDSSKVFTISAWTSGRIDRLYVNEEEMAVSKGEMLYAIYSPELLTTVRDYQLLRERNSSGSLLAAARTRLRQHGLTDALIVGLDKTGDIPETIDVPSPADGLVMNKRVRLGDYVKEGDPLYTIVDLSELWLIIDVYESELPFVKPGQQVTATTPAVPGKVFTGVVELVNHHINPDTRTAQVRVVFRDASQYMETSRGPDGKMRHQHLLLPDMWMNAEIKRDLGKVLVVPASAVFDTGRQQYVFVQQSKGVFVPTLVELGPRVEERQVIRSGVKAGDRVVVDGTFLLDSESQLKAAASGPPKEAPDEETTPKHSLPAEASALYQPLLAAYFGIQRTLTQDQIEGLEAGADAFRKQLETIAGSDVRPPSEDGLYRERLQALDAAAEKFRPANLEEARVQFGRLSAALIDLLKLFPPPLDEPLQVVNCPMWTKSPADWLQSGTAIENPFMGQRMLACGELKSTIEDAK